MKPLNHLLLALVFLSACAVYAQPTRDEKVPVQTMNVTKLVEAIHVGVAEFAKENLGELRDFEIRIVSEKQLVELTFIKRGNTRGGGLQITVDMDQKTVVKKLWLQ